ncbi:tRNA lysidine(34) synthetase TilS [Hwangdonia lutea]|uniref:tRNA(Ile)-lysidine synthase n=1 Tax=Hwangdonia lutea TaxID=3075823 RepID=A0AA97HQU5_9FLAO|nr:tRNA lysidine(34) synthetase TilS [Hwangdonia sp. SCSIO 19198]WOD43093.1 tRNA lysidine(34) synthetase TilS [Hwangdonia sp. SCSIO 19198]
MLEQFKDHIKKDFSFLKKSKLLIAISGGMDSVVLTHLCHQLHFNMALAHCNFNLRGHESDADETFVLDVAEDLELEVFIESFDTETFAKDNKISIQMAARELRYNWFDELTNQLKFDYILTAHHADDNLETFLINLSRGTGLEGLTGIPADNNKLVRPLLPFSREAIGTYANTKKMKWREDSSNASTKYLRNKLRHDVIPILKEVNPQLLHNFQNTLSHLKGSSHIIAESIDAFLSKAIESMDNNKVKFKISEFKKLKHPKPYLYETFKEFGFTQWDDILNLLDAETGKQVFSATYRLIKNRAHLLLSEINLDESIPILISENDNKVETSFGILFFDEADAVSKQQSSCIYVDKVKLKFPLILRKWEEGDVFYPFGMQGKKKLSKYFKDEKLSLLDKEKIWLLCSDNKIVWVIGKRADNRFKVTESTKQILKIELK